MAENLQNIMQPLDCFDSIIQSMTDLVIVANPNGTIRAANKAALNLLGYQEKELIGKPMESILAVEKRGTLTGKHFGQLVRGDSPANNEMTCRTKGGRLIPVTLLGKVAQATDGEKITLENSARPGKDGRGNAGGTVFMFHDISGRKRAERALRESEMQLGQVQKMEVLGQLAGEIAHDFNNLLTVIQGCADLALMDVEEGTSVHRNLDEIRKASTRCCELARQLLLFKRGNSMELTRLDLNTVVDNSIQTLKRLIGEKVSLTTDLDTGLWTIKGNNGTIERMITNLLVNARDAMPNGGEIEIKTQNVLVDEDYCRNRSHASPGRFAALSVRDTGEGISDNIINRVFEPFFSTREIEKGTGLGLSVVHAIVKEYGGWIDVANFPGKGANLTVFLPAACPTPEKEQKTPMSSEEFDSTSQRFMIFKDK